MGWRLQDSGTTQNLNGISFINASYGTVVGNSCTILHTVDGGENWSTAQEGWMIDYYGIQMVTSTLGFAVGKNSIYQPLVEKTTDCWQSWRSIIFYLDGNEGAIVKTTRLSNSKHWICSWR